MNRMAALHPAEKVQFIIKVWPTVPRCFYSCKEADDRGSMDSKSRDRQSNMSRRVWEPNTGEGFTPGWESRLVVGITVRSPF